MAVIYDLKKASAAKNDEFYTQLKDIENELSHYKNHFKNKVVFCNCDDPYESNFFKYFALNFNHLGLKKLICTCYAGSPIVTSQLSLFDVKGLKIKEGYEKSPYKIEITEVDDANGDGAIDISDVEYLLKNKENSLSLLNGDGDFRSKECIELLKESDIVVTNPPFSLFREYISQLFKYEKKFVILGNPNSITYQEIFPLIKDNKLWIGYKSMGSDMLFDVSKEHGEELVKTKNEGSGYRIVDGKIKARAAAIWFTNLDISKRHDEKIIFKQYNPNDYPKYDNYDAINVDKVDDIPCDYYKPMGVPITFLDKYNPDVFRIIGMTTSALGVGLKTKVYGKQKQHSLKNGVEVITDVTKLNDGPAIKIKGVPNKYPYYEVEGNKYLLMYARVIIQRIDGDEEDGNKVA